MEKTGPSLTSRALAILVLAIAGWFLLKFVIGVLTGIATAVMVVLALIAVFWAVRQL